MPLWSLQGEPPAQPLRHLLPLLTSCQTVPYTLATFNAQDRKQRTPNSMPILKKKINGERA